MNFEKFLHQIFLNSYLCSHVCSQCHQSSSAAFSEWPPKQWCLSYADLSRLELLTCGVHQWIGNFNLSIFVLPKELSSPNTSQDILLIIDKGSWFWWFWFEVLLVLKNNLFYYKIFIGFQTIYFFRKIKRLRHSGDLFIPLN